MAETAWSTHNTKVAAAFNQLGFPIRVQVNERAINDNLTGDVLVTFTLYEPNVKKPALRIKPLVEALESGQLEASQPMHPLLTGIRVNNSYEIIMSRLKTGCDVKLVPIIERLKDSPVTLTRAMCYAYGQPANLAVDAMWPTNDLSLAIACSVIGAPIAGIDGVEGNRRFWMPQFGFPLQRADGSWFTADSAQLCTRANPGKSLDLLIEASEPAHPLVVAYEARVIHGQLLKRVREKRRTLVVGPRTHTGRYSLISEYASNRVLDQVAANLRLPPVQPH